MITVPTINKPDVNYGIMFKDGRMWCGCGNFRSRSYDLSQAALYEASLLETLRRRADQMKGKIVRITLICEDIDERSNSEICAAAVEALGSIR